MKCDLTKEYAAAADLPSALQSWLDQSPLSAEERVSYAKWLNDEERDLRDALNSYFESDELKQSVTPVWIQSEPDQSIVTLLLSQHEVAPEPGEYGSILAYARAYGYEADFLCSDCYGQLSCSSCAVEVLQGQPENPTPKEEEYDMLDIDLEKPPTEFTRLSCQTVVGTEPLFCRIRSAVKVPVAG